MATTNYDLPTIVGTDTVSTVDAFNGLANATDAALQGVANTVPDIAPLQAQINTVSDKADTASTNANAAQVTANGAVSTANDASIVADAATASAQAAITAANAADARAVNAQSGVAAINAYLTMTSLTTLSGATLSGRLVSSPGFTIASADLHVVTNSAKTYGKIYGVIRATGGATGAYDLTVDLSGLIPAPTAEYTIVPAGFVAYNGAYSTPQVSYTFKTNGQLVINAYLEGTIGSSPVFNLYPSFYNFADFGDTPIPIDPAGAAFSIQQIIADEVDNYLSSDAGASAAARVLAAR